MGSKCKYLSRPPLGQRARDIWRGSLPYGYFRQSLCGRASGNGETMKAAACAKHFAVHSGPEALRHEFNAEVSQKDMEETYLPAFKALVEDAHVEAVMGAYNCVNGEPCCGSKTLIKINFGVSGILKGILFLIAGQ